VHKAYDLASLKFVGVKVRGLVRFYLLEVVVLALLGRGGFSEVRKAYPLTVAVKVRGHVGSDPCETSVLALLGRAAAEAFY
jgi:hypothetical protein